MVTATMALEIDQADPQHAHQPLAIGIVARISLDLARQTLDPLVEPAQGPGNAIQALPCR